MKLAGKQRRVGLAVALGATVMIIATSARRPLSPETTVDLWLGGGPEPSHFSAASTEAACGRRHSNADGWAARIEGGAGEIVRGVDVVIPRPASSGTASFYLGLTIARPRSIDQVTIETRGEAVRRVGDGRAWVEATGRGVRMAVVGRGADSLWYVVLLQCRAKHETAPAWPGARLRE